MTHSNIPWQYNELAQQEWYLHDKLEDLGASPKQSPTWSDSANQTFWLCFKEKRWHIRTVRQSNLGKVTSQFVGRCENFEANLVGARIGLWLGSATSCRGVLLAQLRRLEGQSSSTLLAKKKENRTDEQIPLWGWRQSRSTQHWGQIPLIRTKWTQFYTYMTGHDVAHL